MRELWECNWWRQYWVFQSFWFERNAFPLKTKSRRSNGSWFWTKNSWSSVRMDTLLVPLQLMINQMESPDFFCKYLLSRNPGLRQPQFYIKLLNVTMMIHGVMTSGCVWPNISLPGPPIWCLDTGNHCIAGMDNIRFPSRDSYSRCNIEYMAVKILFSWFRRLVQNILSLLKDGDLICFIRNCQIWNFRNIPKVEMNYGQKILLDSIISSCLWQTKIPFQFESGPAGKTGREFKLFLSLPVQNHHWQFLPAIKWDFNCQSFLPASDHMHWRSSRARELEKFTEDESWNRTIFVSIESMKWIFQKVRYWPVTTKGIIWLSVVCSQGGQASRSPCQIAAQRPLPLITSCHEVITRCLRLLGTLQQS